MKCYRFLGLLATALAMCLFATGCSGITASPSISPASFLLPGLVESAPETDAAPVAEVEEPAQQLALAR